MGRHLVMNDKKLYVLIAFVTICTIVALSYRRLGSSQRIMLITRASVTHSFKTDSYSSTTSTYPGVCQRRFQTNHLMTVKEPLGRLGNNLFQLLTLLGVTKDHCYTPVITEQFAALLNQVFNLSFIDTISNIPKSWEIFHEGSSGTVYAPAIEMLSHTKNWTLSGYFQSWRYFDKYKDYIKSRLRFRNDIKKDVRRYLTSTIEFVNKTKICVHQRRGDFIDKRHRKAGFSSPDPGFLNRTMQYYLNKLTDKQLVFIYLSDDIDWCKKNIKNTHVYFSPFSSSRSSTSAGKDLALMSLCDHSVVSSGSFGWLGAWLGRGHVVYFKGFPVPGSQKDKRMNRYDYYPPYWIGMT